MARILLVEPDRPLAEIYAKTLTETGHHVTACAGAQAGVIAADQQKPDLVILELQLVEHSGLEFLYEFRSYPDWQNVPVIIQSHVPSAEFNDNGQLLRDQLGVTAYLYKPRANLRQLLKTVDEH